MNPPPTAWTATCMLGGLVALIFHTILTYGSALGAGLGSTPDSQVPELANQLWVASLIGALVVGILLALTMIRYRMMWWRLYAGGWLFVVICTWAGCWVYNEGYPSYVDQWMLVDMLLAVITVGSGWYALRHYPREYFAEVNAQRAGEHLRG